MPRQTREERAARKSATGRRWAAWLKPAMAESGIGPSELAERAAPVIRALDPDDEGFDKSSVSHWLNEEYGAKYNSVIAIAQVLGRDPIPALREAGHEGIAALAEKMRADAAAAIVEQELEAIEDDPYLGHLERCAQRGIISKAERGERRRVYLENKRADVEGMAGIYTDERDRLRAEEDATNGSPRRTAL
jgi:hypothetical protein